MSVFEDKFEAQLYAAMHEYEDSVKGHNPLSSNLTSQQADTLRELAYTASGYKQYDMAVAALSITPERARQVDFSEAYVEDGYKVIVNKSSQLGDDFAALAGKTVAAEEGSYAVELLKAQANGAKVIPVHDTEAGIKLVADGKADALVASKIVASLFITHN